MLAVRYFSWGYFRAGSAFDTDWRKGGAYRTQENLCSGVDTAWFFLVSRSTGPDPAMCCWRREEYTCFECDTSTVLSWEAPHRLPVVAPGPVGNQEQETVEP